VHVTVSLTVFTVACASTLKVGLSPRALAIKKSAVYPARSKLAPLVFFGQITNSYVSPL
jgi:hypothetical protein